MEYENFFINFNNNGTIIILIMYSTVNALLVPLLLHLNIVDAQSSPFIAEFEKIVVTWITFGCLSFGRIHFSSVLKQKCWGKMRNVGNSITGGFKFKVTMGSVFPKEPNNWSQNFSKGLSLNLFLVCRESLKRPSSWIKMLSLGVFMGLNQGIIFVTDCKNLLNDHGKNFWIWILWIKKIG